jgi:CcmD family protein
MNGYLIAAYTATWIIHIAYLTTLVTRYARLKRQIEENQVLGPRR